MLMHTAPPTGGRGTPPPADLVMLFDVDNTLLDNDRFSADLDAQLVQALGEDGRARYRQLYERLRDGRGYADYLAPLQLLRRGFEDDPDLLELSTFLLDYPFGQRVYPGVWRMLAQLQRFATIALLSDGDLVFQPRKIRRSGLWDAVQGRVLITLHKERELDSVRSRLPALHYVLVDDKPRLLDAAKAELGAGVTTVFVRQGHYASEADADAATHPPDLRLDHVGDLAVIAPDLLRPAGGQPREPVPEPG
jgi:FMN phosphatase YigB (HAD superfamily)